MPQQPDLETPFTDERERGAAFATLLGACVELERWRALARAELPPGSSEQPTHATEVGDPAGFEPARWLELFEDELLAVFDVRNRVVHGVRLSDTELRSANWLAVELLGLLTAADAA
jgi:hypothetical protein